MLRDLVLTGFILAALALTFKKPFAGVLAWTWIAIMAPHREAYGVITSTMRINLLVAVIAFLAWFFSKERKQPVVDATFITVILFFVWTTINSLAALDPEVSWVQWDTTWRILALGLMVSLTATNRIRIHALIWVVVVSLLYYGTKGGFLSIMSGGSKTISGPSSTIIGDNNQLALALLMILPLVNYLRMYTKNRWVRMGLIVAGSLTFLSVVSSYSRGAFIALATLFLLGWLRSRNKFVYPIFLAVVAVPIFLFMPQTFWDRMNTMHSLDKDESFQGRLDAWHVAYSYAANHIPFGAGFNGLQSSPEVFLSYSTQENSSPRAAHSIYFQVLGDQGFMGLGLYLMIIFLALANTQIIRGMTRGRPELAWMRDLATMIQLSLVAFFTGGAALSMAYYDVFVLWIALLPVLKRMARQSKKRNIAIPPDRRPAYNNVDDAVAQGSSV